MNNEKELKEIEEEIKIKESEKLQKFGFDISKVKGLSKEKIMKNRKIRKVAKIVIEIVLIAFALRLIIYLIWYIFKIYEVMGNV